MKDGGLDFVTTPPQEDKGRKGEERGLDAVLEGLKGKTLVITGGAGYVATNIVKALADTPCQVVRLDREGVEFPAVRGAFDLEDRRGDVRDERVWPDLLKRGDVVFHLAGQTSAYAAARDPAADFEINVRPVLALAAACSNLRRRPDVVFAGTVTEAGLTDRLPVDETHPDDPLTIYDLHKLAAERYLRHFAREGVLRACTLRLANVYGPGPKSGSADRGILNRMIALALRGETLTLFGGGEWVRDYVYVGDVAAAFLYAADEMDRLNAGHFLIGSGVGHTLAEAFSLVAERAAAVTGRRVALVKKDFPPGSHPMERRNFVADTSRFRALTGWRAAIPLGKGIDLTIESYMRTEGKGDS